MITRIIAFARGLMRRRKIDDEIVEELQDHIEREIEMHRARGVSLDDARRMIRSRCSIVERADLGNALKKARGGDRVLSISLAIGAHSFARPHRATTQRSRAERWNSAGVRP